MKKFYIIPNVDVAMEVECDVVNTKKEAIEYFADFMSLDMNDYFVALTEDEYNELKNN